MRTSFTYRNSTFLKKTRLITEQMLAIMRLYRSNKFEIMHAHGFAAALSALPCKFIFRVPIVITTHGSEMLWPKETRWVRPAELRLTLRFDSLIMRMCDLIIAQSKGVKKYMVAFYGRAIETKVKLVPTGLDEKKFSVPTKAFADSQVLFVGALSEIKGVTCLLNAFSKVHEKHPDAKLVLVGGGPATQHYKELAEVLGLERSVDFAGVIRDDNRLLEFYAASDILALPSTVGAPIPVTILEAMSCGKAVVSTNTLGSIPDILTRDVGIIIEPGDTDQLAREIERLIIDKELQRNLGQNAREAIVKFYTLDIMIDKLLYYYGMLTGR